MSTSNSSETTLSKTFTCVQIGPRTLMLPDSTDFSEFPDEVLDKVTFEYTTPNTGDLIRISDLLLDHNLRRDGTGNYSATAYRLAYAVSFARAVCSKITVTMGSGEKTVIESAGHPLDKAAVENVATDVLYAFSQQADPTVIKDADIEQLLKKKKSAPTPESTTPTPE